MQITIRASLFAALLLGVSLNAAAQTQSASYATASGSYAYGEQQQTYGYAGSTFGSPLAFGASGGAVGVGVFALRDGSRNGNGHFDDGSAGITLGLGDPSRYVGLETSVGLSSLTGHNGDGFGKAGSFAFKLHTELPGSASFALGVIDVAPWGAADGPNSASVYVAAAKVFPLTLFGSRYALVGNVGIGDNQFTHSTRGSSPFGSLAFFFRRQVSLIVDDSGRFLNAGVSVAPFEHVPLSFTLGAFNLGREEGLKTGIAGSVGFGYDLSRFW
ncbi:hypothetical protein [Solimonas terrae]|uniref:Transporter n=1 Tax=Solimonas terrae TaxID=1396819 RepID=A0A6M2BS79_9GAMM|nr:hypothetical protein [Solimonas terrae]NGY04857.1 hypothetical protein [Solimonas terrae]